MMFMDVPERPGTLQPQKKGHSVEIKQFFCHSEFLRDKDSRVSKYTLLLIPNFDFHSFLHF